MKNALLYLLLAVPVFSQSQYTIDPAHTAALFTVKHMMMANVRGEFKKVSGTVLFDDRNPANSKVDATIDATTINTREDARDAHLKSPDFFDVAKFPTLTFQSTRVDRQGDKYLVTGNLTIHGVTRQTVLTVDTPSKEMKDPYGLQRAGTTASTKINRKDFGLVWNKTLDGGGLLVGDEVTITLDVEMTRKP